MDIHTEKHISIILTVNTDTACEAEEVLPSVIISTKNRNPRMDKAGEHSRWVGQAARIGLRFALRTIT